MEIDNTIFHDLDSVGKEECFKTAIEKLSRFVL